MEIRVAKAYPNNRNCRKKDLLSTPRIRARMMVEYPTSSMMGAKNSKIHI
jgi:hypothetical protein